MNTYNRSQGMDNRLNMLFNQELNNEAQYIKSHPFSSINMSLGGEVRYIAPIWPWNAPRFQAIDWRTQPPPRRLPGETKHDQGKMFELPKTWNESTNQSWSEDQRPPATFPNTRTGSSRGAAQFVTRGFTEKDSKSKEDYSVTMTGGALRSQQSTPGTPGRNTLAIDMPVSQLPGRARPVTGASGASSRIGTSSSARDSRVSTSNLSARAAARQLIPGV